MYAFVASAATAASAVRDAAGVANPSADPTAQADIDALIHDLQDPERRATLIEQLRALQEARTDSEAAAHSLADLDVARLLEQGADGLFAIGRRVLETDVVWLLQHVLLSAVIVLVGIVCYRFARRGLRRLEDRLAHRDPERTDRRRLRLSRRIIRAGLLLVTLTLVLQIWGLSLAQWITGLSGVAWVRTTFSLLLIGAATLLAWSLADAVIRGTMRAQSDRLGNARQRSRLLTVTPLLQGATRIGIGVLALLLILAQLGLNIGPLLAGAGIIGLAVGFGAQSLIKDLLIGITLLLEDAASVGDVIDVSGTVGEVEEMGIRMLRLRGLDGTVHMIPYSDIGRVSNLTKDYAFAMLDVRVAYKERVDDVVESLVDIARELRDDADLAPLILEDLEVMGVNALADSGVEIRVRLKTLPLERWRIAREFRRRIKARFDEAGIEIPYPHRILYFAGEKAGSTPDTIAP
ncbi:MAG: mechanosensitive ion channel family protein [Pseudomonadales bacterium]